MTECQKIEKTRIMNASTVYWVSTSKVFHCAPVSPMVNFGPLTAEIVSLV